MKSALFLFLLSLAIGPLAASEPDADEYQAELFRATDLNKDGKVTRREFVVTVLYDSFMSIADKTGQISESAYYKWAKQHPEIDAKKEYKMMDTENKGYLVFGDVMKNKIAIKEMEVEFRKLDKKKKGYITMKDLPDLEDEIAKPSKP